MLRACGSYYQVFRYGDHVSENSYYISHDVEKTNAMFNRLRNFDNVTNSKDVIVDKTRGHSYPRRLGPFLITGVRDLTTGFDSRAHNGNAVCVTSSAVMYLQLSK